MEEKQTVKRTVRRAVFEEGYLLADAIGETPPRDTPKDIGSTAMAAETERAVSLIPAEIGKVAPISQSVDLPPGLPPEARPQAAA